MKKSVLTIAALVLVVSTHFLCAQVQTPLHVEAFGGVQDPLPAMTVPPELKPFVPSGFTLRTVLATKMAPSGEKLFLYDNGEDPFPDVRLHALHDGNDFVLLDGTITGVGGLLPITLPGGRQLLAFAYHRGFDVADTQFVIFTFEDQSYHSIFERVTTEGRMQVLKTSPLRFEIWSADETFDKEDESCVWCPHRYTIVTYELKGDNFDVVAMRTTEKYLVPSEVAGEPFVGESQPSKPGGRPR
jgi:hypothetical protein